MTYAYTLRASLDFVGGGHGLGAHVDHDEIVERAAQDYLTLLDGGAEVWYCWRVRVDGRLLIPRSNPHVYESPADLLFLTTDDAHAWFGEELDAHLGGQDDNEVEYMRTWVLVKETLQVVGEPHPMTTWAEEGPGGWDGF